MYKNLLSLSTNVVMLALAMSPCRAQDMEGTWTARLEKDGTVHFQFEKEYNQGQIGHDIPLKDLVGLPAHLDDKPSTSYSFKLVRPAGTIEFEGFLSKKRGYGDYVFHANKGFLKMLEDQDFDRPDRDQMLVFAVTGLSEDEIIGLVKADIGSLTTDDLVKAAIFNISPEYVRSVRKMGYSRIDMEDLVKMRIFSIDAAFIAEMESLGYADLPIEDLVKLKIFNIDGDFIREFRKIRGSKPSIEKLVQLKIFDGSDDE